MEKTNLVTLLSIGLISGSVMAQTPALAKKPAPSTLTGSIQAGTGYWMGDATYSIGGETYIPGEGTFILPDKISELKFPLDVAYGSVGGNLIWKRNFEFFGTLTMNLTEPSSKMEDSDWGVLDDSGSLDIYSESDAELNAVTFDGGARYWFPFTAATNRAVWSLGAGPSLIYQHLDWTISNVDQWYPSQPALGHDTQSGVVATYKADIVMPYLDACVKIQNKRLSGRAEIGFGPALVQDEDDHILRQKRSTATLLGFGLKGAAEIRYDLTRHLFALARIDMLSITATGTSKDEGYGGDLEGFYAEITEDFTLTSFTGGLSIGYGF
jgi:hypothetical protein